MALLELGAELLGGFLNRNAAKKQDELNYKRQKEFAQKGIQWKSADALKAGIHPIYAMGGSTASFSPSAVGDTSLGDSLSRMGQSVGRAAAAGMTGEGRATAFESAVQDLTVKKMGLENELLASQIRTINQPGLGPGFPSGNSDDPLIAFGKEVTRSPNMSDAQTFSTRYGEPAEWVVSPFIAGADALASGKKAIGGTAGSSKKTGSFWSDWYYGRK